MTVFSVPCYIIAHHHTYEKINSIPYQVLVEADFLVTIDEDAIGKNETESIKNKLCKTKTGIKLLDHMYLVT